MQHAHLNALTKLCAILGIPDSPQYAEDPEINRKVSIFGANMTSLKVDGIVRSTDTSLTSDDGSKC